MKKTKKIIVSLCAFALMAFVVTACADMFPTPQDALKVESISLNKSSDATYVGEEFTLKATITPGNASDRRASWSSSNTEVATVDAYGKVTTKKQGTATITVTTLDGGKEAKCLVEVKNVEIAGLALSETNLALKTGETFKLDVTFTPENVTFKTVKWESSEENVATVDDKGKVTAIAEGTATITVSTLDGSVSAGCAVTVTNVEIDELELSAEEMELKLGASFQLNVNIFPDDATVKTVKWTSSDPNVATVDDEGNVTAEAIGTATITVSTLDDNVSDTCEVTVSDIEITDLELSVTELTLRRNRTVKLDVIISPDDATETLTWSSSNDSIATVDNDGNVLTINSGTVVITASTPSGIEASCTITVRRR
jgi:Bacterial surface proteins containing Ig-like domains